MFKYSGVKKSNEAYERAGQIIPGWTQLISRRASRFANGISPTYAQSAKGSRFLDIDGNQYIDWVNACSAVILGHADEVVDNAVKEQIDKGSLLTVNSLSEIELAEELIRTIPSAEMVRYTKGGGEACAVAVRIARGTTGRDKILFCGYHGWHDWYQSANYLVDPDTGEFPFAGIEPIGVPKVLAGTAIPFSYGDLEMLEKLFQENRGEVAAVMMEPLRSELPNAEYLEGVKDISRRHGALLIFDEVSCGWRMSLGGMQEYVGVTPDMTVVAKAMSNGYPMGAVVGSRESMEDAARMFVSSSYWSDILGIVASITTIRELRRRNSVEGFKFIGERLTEVLNQVIKSVGISARISGLHYHPTLSIDVPEKSLTGKVNTLFVQEMAKRGIHTGMHFMATLAHTMEDIQITAEAVEGSLRVVREGLEGRIDELLECDIKQDPFKRLVK